MSQRNEFCSAWIGEMPLQLQVVDPHQLDAPSGIAIAIAGLPVTGSVDQRHIGFILERDEAWWLVHLAWENHFRCDALAHPDTPASQYCYVSMDLLEPYNEYVFREWLFELQQNNAGRVPYSIALSHEPRFDDNGNLLPFGVGEGFTCASFVKSVLELYGVDLIDANNWPVRHSDGPWQRYIIARLQGYASAESIAAQMDLIGSVARYRPEEIVGAAIAQSLLPIDQRIAYSLVEAEPLGGQIRGEMIRLNKL